MITKKRGHCRGACLSLSHHILRPTWLSRGDKVRARMSPPLVHLCLFKSPLLEVCCWSAYGSLKSWTNSWVNAVYNKHIFFSWVGGSKWRQPVPYRDCQIWEVSIETCSWKGAFTVIRVYRESGSSSEKSFLCPSTFPFFSCLHVAMTTSTVLDWSSSAGPCQDRKQVGRKDGRSATFQPRRTGTDHRLGWFEM